MLAADEEPDLPSHATWWRSRSGFDRFEDMLRQRMEIGDFDRLDEQSVHEQYARSLVGIEFMTDEAVERRLLRTAAALSTAVQQNRKKSRRFREFCTQAQPPRHSVWYGSSDQHRCELVAFGGTAREGGEERYKQFLIDTRRSRRLTAEGADIEGMPRTTTRRGQMESR